MCSREMTISSAWNSVETIGRVAKKQPLCITGWEGWLCWGGKWWYMWMIKSGLPSVVETHQLYLRLPFPTVMVCLSHLSAVHQIWTLFASSTVPGERKRRKNLCSKSEVWTYSFVYTKTSIIPISCNKSLHKLFWQGDFYQYFEHLKQPNRGN